MTSLLLFILLGCCRISVHYHYLVVVCHIFTIVYIVGYGWLLWLATGYCVYICLLLYMCSIVCLFNTCSFYMCLYRLFGLLLCSTNTMLWSLIVFARLGLRFNFFGLYFIDVYYVLCFYFSYFLLYIFFDIVSMIFNFLMIPFLVFSGGVVFYGCF